MGYQLKRNKKKTNKIKKKIIEQNIKKDIKRTTKEINNILCEEYECEDNILPQVEQLASNIIEKKQLIDKMKKLNDETDNTSEKDVSTITKEIENDLAKITELENSQEILDHTQMEPHEILKSYVRLTKIAIIRDALMDELQDETLE